MKKMGRHDQKVVRNENSVPKWESPFNDCRGTIGWDKRSRLGPKMKFIEHIKKRRRARKDQPSKGGMVKEIVRFDIRIGHPTPFQLK